MTIYYTNSVGLIHPTTYILEEMDKLRDGNKVMLLPVISDMFPSIPGNGRVEIELSPLEGPAEKGDIVIAHSDAGLVLHRIVEIEENGSIVLMADESSFSVEHCKQKDIYGKVTRIMDSVSGAQKHLTKGRLWRALLPVRPALLGIFRLFIPSLNHQPAIK